MMPEACVAVIGLESIAGICSNAFIISHLIVTSYKERRVTSCNSILMSLSISNVCFALISPTNLLISFLWPWLFNLSELFYVIYYSDVYALSLLSWLTSVLCFFYFIKIRRFQPGFLAWVKMKIDTMVPWMILSVVVISLLEGYFTLIFDLGLPKNSTDLNSELLKRRMNVMKPAILMSLIPFIGSLLSSAGSAWFLRRSAGSFGSTAVKNYQSTVNIMIFFVSFYALIYLFFALYGLQIFAVKSWGYWMSAVIIYSFTAIQAGVIISGNPKLREAWRRLFPFADILNHNDG